jgi:hypothetical protein
MIVVADPQWAEAALIEGRLPCPRCSGMLRPWASARVRRVRGLPDPVQPRRARCPGCERSQVLPPGAVLPRRADATEVVGTALVAKAAGAGTGGSPLTWTARCPRSGGGCGWRAPRDTPTGSATKRTT